MASDKSPPRLLPPAAASSSDSTLSSAGESSDKPASTPNGSSKGGSADAPATRDAATANGLQSQPMTTTTSQSSDHAAAEPESSSTTPAAYGTRSRNRHGTSRPNYAEDGDGDMEFEAALAVPRGSRKAAASSAQNSVNASPATPATEGDRASGVSTRRAHATANGNTKDAIPGTSSFFAGPNANNGAAASKKRKQPGTNNAHSSPAPAAPSASTKNTDSSVVQYSHSQTQSDTNMPSFEDSGGYLKDGKLIADDGTVYEVNGHAYMICEPPGEPYYLCRIMEFHPGKDDPTGPIETVRVNWYYRPRDILRNLTDSRLLFASMHSDICPLSSLRGKCQVTHLSEIKNLDEYRKTRDCFWYDKMFDRYIHRYYDVIPTYLIINVPEEVKKVLDERWKFVTVETGHPRRKELTSAVKTCKKCRLYAATNSSVDCAVCGCTFHMTCVRPVLEKKPARGFAWACAYCSSEQDRRLESRDTPVLGDLRSDTRNLDQPEDEEDEKETPEKKTEEDKPADDDKKSEAKPPTPEQIALSKIWPFRYLGAHCPVEDTLDYDDRIYPRAGSRTGNRYQVSVIPWPGRPVEYVKAPEIKKKYMRGSGHRKDGKLSKETIAAIEADKAERAKRPKWVLDEPAGYIRRGEDEPVTIGNKQVQTSELRFKMPDASQLPSRGEDDDPGSSMSSEDREKFIDDYMERAKAIAPTKGLEKYSTNFLDKALALLYEENFKPESALARLKQVNKYTDLKEPRLRPEEVKLFESGVGKYGSELRNVTKHVGTVPHRHIVRFYYMWKKTDKGRQIWGNFHGRRRKKEAKRIEKMKLVDDIADDYDDSAFDTAKAAAKKRGFQCMFCNTKNSRLWRRAPSTPPTRGGTSIPEPPAKRDKGGNSLTTALCQRCAVLWRKYGIRWENLDEVAKKVTQGGNKSWRRRADEELLTQLIISAENSVSMSSSTAAMAAAMGVPVPAAMTSQQQPQEPPKKKIKATEKDRTSSPAVTTNPTPAPEPAPKKKPVVEKPPEPPALVPDPPRAKVLPCAVCDKMEPMGDQHLSCRDCRLTVHRSCYGISPERSSAKWFCDMCSNDRNPTRSTSYECVLCPVTWTEHELMEPPKISHKKKNDREREKERLEKEMVTEAIKLYRQRQEAAGKPVGPREPLKPTAGNNWIHVACAVWTPEIKFGDAKLLEPVEGLGLIPGEKYQATCKLCKTNTGACVPCHNTSCNAQFHVGCASQAGYIFGFDVNPVKSSRRDTINTIKLGEETGAATAAIWCPHHTISTVIHKMDDINEKDGLNTLQLFAQTFKQADLTLTGTVRKAAHIQQSVGASSLQSVLNSNRRSSTTNGTASHQYRETNNPSKARKTSPTSTPSRTENADITRDASTADSSIPKKCSRCQTTCSPKWWSAPSCSRRRKVNGPSPLANGTSHDEPTESGPSTSQSLAPKVNGEASDGQDKPAIVSYDGASDPVTPRKSGFECHKCHLKQRSPSPSSSPEPRVSPYVAQPSPAPPIRPSGEHPQNSYGAPQPGQPTSLPRPQMVPPAHGPEYEPRHGEYGNPNLRNGIPPPAAPQTNGIPPPGPHPGYPGGPPAPAPQPQMNGYAPQAPPHHPSQGPPPQPHYANGVPPPPHGPHIHSYQTHQSPYPPVAPAPGSHPPPILAPAGHPYGAAASPPEVHSNLVQRSPSRSLGGPSPPRPLPPRMYSVERVMHSGPPQPSNPAPRPSLDSNRPSTPGMGMNPDETSGASGAAPAPRPSSSSRNANTNNAAPGSGASASPSLKNLLS